MLAVRSSIDECRKASFAGRSQNIRSKVHAVPHRNDDVLVMNDACLVWRRCRDDRVPDEQQDRDDKTPNCDSERLHNLYGLRVLLCVLLCVLRDLCALRNQSPPRRHCS
jgi:hypothetical protein